MSLCVDEWLVSVYDMSMYEDATTVVNVNGRDKAFGVKVGVNQGSVLTA